MQSIKSKNEKYKLNSENCINFNHVYCQKYAQKIKIPEEVKNYQQITALCVEWFAKVRNFGCVYYKGEIYNLNLKSDEVDMLFELQSEGFLKIVNKSYDVIIIDPDFRYMGKVSRKFLWLNLINKKLSECSAAQMKAYNARVFAEEKNLHLL